jgi:hypothetical protein
MPGIVAPRSGVVHGLTLRSVSFHFACGRPPTGCLEPPLRLQPSLAVITCGYHLRPNRSTDPLVTRGLISAADARDPSPGTHAIFLSVCLGPFCPLFSHCFRLFFLFPRALSAHVRRTFGKPTITAKFLFRVNDLRGSMRYARLLTIGTKLWITCGRAARSPYNRSAPKQVFHNEH